MKRGVRAIAAFLAGFSVAACAAEIVDVLRGQASYYADSLHGEITASGEAYDRSAMTAAHPSLPFGTRLKVTNLENGKSVEVTVNDRGPYVDDRILDLSAAAAKKIGMHEAGLTEVKIEVYGD